jgi:HSP20 family molecular chaperone IbpA
MKNPKAKVEVPGYDKSEVSITLNYGLPTLDLYYTFVHEGGNEDECYLTVEAKNEELGKKKVNIYPEEDIDTLSIEAEVKNGMVYLNWNTAVKKSLSIPIKVS